MHVSDASFGVSRFFGVVSNNSSKRGTYALLRHSWAKYQG
jgi:hypothetical protein